MPRDYIYIGTFTEKYVGSSALAIYHRAYLQAVLAQPSRMCHIACLSSPRWERMQVQDEFEFY